MQYTEEYNELKSRVLTVLRKFEEVIENDGDLNQLTEHIAASCAGDGYGDQNTFIDFGHWVRACDGRPGPHGDGMGWETMDIGDVLASLHEYAGRKGKLRLPF